MSAFDLFPNIGRILARAHYDRMSPEEKREDARKVEALRKRRQAQANWESTVGGDQAVGGSPWWNDNE